MTRAGASPERTHALVVGIERYDAGPTWDLDGPAGDAARFAAWLVDRGVPPEQVLVFISPLKEESAPPMPPGIIVGRARSSDIEEALTETLPALRGDLLWLFWAGHGVDTGDDQQRLFYADATINDKRNLHLPKLLERLRSDRYPGLPRQIAVVDACQIYAERLQYKLPTQEFSPGTPLQGREQFVLYAASPGQAAVNRGSDKAGLFSQVVTEELNGPAADGWPPNMDAVAASLVQRFEDLNAAGRTDQKPTWFEWRGWKGERRVLGDALSARQEPVAGADQGRVLVTLVRLPSSDADFLAGLMFKTQAMSDQGGRDAVVAEVQASNPSFAPSRDQRASADVGNIIEACKADDESFDLLLDAIQTRSSSDDPAVLDLLEFVQRRLRRAALSKQELRKLLLLLQPEFVRPEQLRTLIGKALREKILAPGAERTISAIEDVRRAALFLLDHASAETGLCRLLRFVDGLAQEAVANDESSAPKLRRWIDDVAAAHTLDPSDWRTAATSERPESDPVLLIEMDPKTSSRDRFAVHLWLLTPDAGIAPLDWPSNPCRSDWCGLEDLREQVDELLEEAEDKLLLLGVKGNLRVEFWLIDELLHQDVDWWLSGADPDVPLEPWPLGAQYSVVVRPRREKPDRQRMQRRIKPSELRSWDERWHALQNATKPVKELAVWIRDAETYTPAHVRTKLQENPTGVLVAPIGPCEQRDGLLLLCAGLRQGMPVALCLRRAPADATVDLDKLEEELTSTRFTELPDLVRRWRQQAYEKKGQDHLGRHLVLLWDDYDWWTWWREQQIRLANAEGPDR